MPLRSDQSRRGQQIDIRRRTGHHGQLRRQGCRNDRMSASSAAHSTGHSHHLHRRFNDVESNLHLVKEEVTPLTPSPSLDSCLLLQLEEQVGSIRTDLSDITGDILSSKNEDDDLVDKKDRLRKALFELSLQIKHLLHDQPSSPSMLESESRVKLLKIDVPTFNGNILHWNRFCKQFEVSIHQRGKACLSQACS